MCTGYGTGDAAVGGSTAAAANFFRDTAILVIGVLRSACLKIIASFELKRFCCAAGSCRPTKFKLGVH